MSKKIVTKSVKIGFKVVTQYVEKYVTNLSKISQTSDTKLVTIFFHKILYKIGYKTSCKYIKNIPQKWSQNM